MNCRQILTRYLKGFEVSESPDWSEQEDFFHHFELCTDSRQVSSRTLFVPLKGERYDGHDYIESALKKGARGYFYESRKHTPSADQIGRAFCVGESTLQAYQACALAYRKEVLVKTQLIAISGSCGKTTLKEYLRAVLSRVGRVAATYLNENNEIGVPKTLLNTPSETDFLICEMGMRFKEDLKELVRIASPDLCVLTCVEETHLACTKGLEEIYEGKLHLFGEAPEAFWVGPASDPKILKFLRSRRKPARSLYFCDQPQQAVPSDMWGVRVIASESDQGAGLQQVTLQSQFHQGDTVLEFRVSLPSLHQKAPLLLAASLACFQQLLPKEARCFKEGFLGVPAIAGRFRLLKARHFWIIDDAYNASPASMRSGLQSLLNMVKDQNGLQLSLVLGDMLELGSRSGELHRTLGEWLSETFHSWKRLQLFLCGPDSQKHLMSGLSQKIRQSSQIHTFENSQQLQGSVAWSQLINSLESLPKRTNQESSVPEHVIFLKASHGIGLYRVVESLLERFAQELKTL